MNQSSVSRTARQPLKILKDFWRLVHIFLNLFGQWFPKEWDFFPKDFQNLWLQIFEASIIICHLKINLIRKQSFVAALLFFAICFFRVYEKEKNSMKYFFKLDFQIVFTCVLVSDEYSKNLFTFVKRDKKMTAAQTLKLDFSDNSPYGLDINQKSIFNVLKLFHGIPFLVRLQLYILYMPRICKIRGTFFRSWLDFFHLVSWTVLD